MPQVDGPLDNMTPLAGAVATATSQPTCDGTMDWDKHMEAYVNKLYPEAAAEAASILSKRVDNG